jgi:hypothetical protein
MSDPLEYLNNNNIDPNTLLLSNKPVKQGWIKPASQPFYGDYNIASGTELKDIDFESGSNMRSLEDVRGDIRANYQSGFEKFYNSIGQGVGTFGTALASTVATLGGGAVGLVAEGADIFMEGDQFSGMDIALNNPIMKGINDLDKYIKEDLVPTYYTKEQQERVFFSPAFGTDALNGLGFLLSNVVPTGAVTKVFGNWAKMVNATKAGKAASMLDDAVKMGKVTNIEAQIVDKTAKFIDSMGPFVGAAVGRLGESAIEAYGSYTDIKETLTAERDKARFELETYGTTAREDLAMLSDEDIEKRAKEQRDNIFGGNMAMFVSDAFQFSRLFKGGESLASRLTKDGLLNTIKKTTKTGLAKEYLKESLQEAAEEGYQYLLQEGGRKSAIDGGGFLSNMDNSFGDLFSTVEGKRSMLLGALLGGGMSGVRDFRNRKEVKAKLESLVQNLNQSGATNQRYIKDESGQLIINPEFSKVATNFMQYEARKEEALKNNDLVAYEFAEKAQFAELVAAKVDAGQFEDFINELQGLSKASQEEVETMFGELPVKDGVKVSPSQIIGEKISEAKKIKELVEGVDRLPGMNQITRQGKNTIVASLLAQESFRNVYNKIDKELAEVNSRVQMTPNEDGTFTPELLPQDQELADVLEREKKEAFKGFYEAAKIYKDWYEDVTKAERFAEEAKEEAIEKATNEYRESTVDEEKKKQEAVENEAVISDPETGEERIATEINDETGEVLDQNGQPIDTNLLFQEEDNPDPIESTEDVDTKVEARENIEEEDYDKKLGVNSSTGTAFNIVGGERQIKDGEYELDPKFEKQVKVMMDPTISNNVVDNANANPNVIEYKLEIVPITGEEISKTNQRREASGQSPLNKEDFEKNTDYIPIQMTLMVNGKENKSVVSFYHNPEYFRKTAEYAQYEKEHGKEKVEEYAKERIAQLSKQRAKLIEDIKAGKNIVLTTSKSEGVLNYNPTVVNEDGSRSKKLNGVLNVLTSSYEELLNGKDHSLWVVKSSGGKVRVKTKGIQVVTNIETKKDSVITTFTDSAGRTETVTTKDPIYDIGEMTFEVVTSNSSTRKITPFNSEPFTNSQIESLTDLLMDRLMGNQTINIKGTEYNIIGNEQNPGIVDSLIYVGNVKSENPEAIRSQLAFTKSGKLLLGKETIEQPTDNNYQEIRQKVRSHIIGYKSKPQFKIKSVKYFTDNFGIPQKTEDGWVMNNPKSYTSFIFGGDNAMIKTALNKNMFVNSYFLFAESNGDILTRSEKPSITTPVSTDAKADIENYIQDVSNAKNKEELIKAAEKLVGINPYDDGAVSMATRAALMTPGSFDRGKALFLEEVKSVIEQRRKAEKTQGISTTDAKADMPIGKVGNTDYEVKADGVYYKGSKLDNPENKSHRQLIEAEIERRRQETLKNIKPTDKSNEVSNFPLLKGTDVVRYIPESVAQKAWEVWDKEYQTGQSLQRTKERGGFGINEMDMFYPEWKTEIPEAVKINAKYDEELTALEQPVEPTVVDKAIEEKQKECKGGVDSPKSLNSGFDIFDNLD